MCIRDRLCGVGLATFTMAWFGKKDYERIFSTVMMFGYLVASLGAVSYTHLRRNDHFARQ